MNKEFLRDLQDREIILLTRDQVRFFKEVESVLHDKFENDDSIYLSENEINDPEIAYQIPTVLEHLKNIIGHLQAGRKARKRFINTYPKWKKTCEDGIAKLKQIARCINVDRFNCNVSKLVGYCTSFVGAGITLTSAFLVPLTLGLTTPLAVAGGTITAAGCTTAVGTSLTEVILLKTRVNDAKEIMKKDKNYFQEMTDWLDHAEELVKALSDVLQIDVVKDIAESVKDLVEKGMNISNDFKRLNFIQTSLNKMFSTLPKSLLGDAQIGAIFTLASVLVMLYLLLLNTENRVVFDCASLTFRSIFGIASLVDDSMDVVRLSGLFSGSAAATKNIAKAVTRGAVAVLGMALDLTGIALTSIDIHTGSLSPEAEKIEKAAIELEEEAKILQEVYENLH